MTDIMESMTKEDLELSKLLLSLTPRKVTRLVELLSQDEKFNNDNFVDDVKAYFIGKAFIKLDIRVRIYESSYHKFKTQLSRCPLTGKPFVSISKKDSRNMDAAYAKLYDLHKDLLLELVENPLVTEVAAI